MPFKFHQKFHLLWKFCTFEIYVTIPIKSSSDQGEKNYITEIQQDVATNAMMIFTDSSVQDNLGPTGSGVVIKNPGHHTSPIKLAKAITSCGTNYEGEIEAIKLGTDYAFSKYWSG